VGVTGFVIAADLNISSDDFSWIGTSINLGYVVTAPTAGYLQDMFGRRNILIVGSICNILGGIIIATSHGLSQLIVGGVISGMGAAITELTTTVA
jgi:MFS family permease